ncbi:hypothetical protein SDC9_153953 [bioreactor metagenome]|uniref:Uncharacterized protein n=1 Tax=bioreactor metagenome TaxID=1076179 RepID=A0A645EXR7_9ZZZZ
MEYVLGALVGIIYGGLVGLFKYFFLWRKLVKESDNTIKIKTVTIRMVISYVVNVITLTVAYLVRNIIPFDFVAFVIATAFALVLAGKLFSVQKLLLKTEM